MYVILNERIVPVFRIIWLHALRVRRCFTFNRATTFNVLFPAAFAASCRMHYGISQTVIVIVARLCVISGLSGFARCELGETPRVLAFFYFGDLV